MRLIIKYFRQILLTAFLIIAYQNGLYPQETKINTREKPGMFVGFSFGPAQSQIVNKGTLSVSELLSSKKNTFFRSVDIGYFFSEYIGLSSGVGYNSYGAQLTLNTYQNTVNAIDSENETFEMRVSGSDIKEIQKIGFLSIPFCINLRVPFSQTIGFYLQPGINLAIPLSKTFQSTGTFTYKGYYPAYNVLLENLPEYGFPTELSIKSDGKLELNPLNLNAVVSAGFDFFIEKEIKIEIGGWYDKSLLSISNYPSADKFQLSSDVNHINSMMGGSTSALAQSIGVKVTFRYFLKHKKVGKPQEIKVN